MTRCRHRDKELLTNWFQSQQPLPLADPHQGGGAEPHPGAQVQDQPHHIQPDKEPLHQDEHREDSADDAFLLDGRDEGGGPGPVTRSRARTKMRERCQ